MIAVKWWTQWHSRRVLKNMWDLTNKNEESSSGSWNSRQIGVDGEKGLWGCGIRSCRIPLPAGSRRVMWLDEEGSSGWTSWRARAQRAAHSNSCWCLPFPKTGLIYQKMSQLWIFMCYCLLLLCFVLLEDMSLLPAAIQHTALRCPGRSWCYLQAIWLYHTQCTVYLPARLLTQPTQHRAL